MNSTFTVFDQNRT